jgi:hypothetical protein
MDVGAALVTYLEPPEAVEPGECPFHHPPISTEPLARFDAAPSNTRDDASSAERLAAPIEVTG